MDCSVCLEYFNAESQILSTTCDHFFHAECINSWMSAGTQTCPLCRKTLTHNNLRSIHLRFSPQDYESKISHVQIIYEGFEEMPTITYAQDVTRNREHYFGRPIYQTLLHLIRRLLDFLCLCQCMGQ